MIRIGRITALLAYGCPTVAGAIVVSIAAIGTANVVGYTFLGGGVPAALELSESGLAAAFFLALPLTQLRRAHVDVDIVATLLPRSVDRPMRMAALLIALVVFALMAWMGVPSLERSIRLSESAQGSIPYPIWPVKLAALAGLIATTLVCFVQIVGRSRSDAA